MLTSTLRRHQDTLQQWFNSRSRNSPQDQAAAAAGFDLLRQTLIYDPNKRITARASLTHHWWGYDPKPHSKWVLCSSILLRRAGLTSRAPHSAFLGLPTGVTYPMRRVTHDESDPKLSSNAGRGSFASAGGSGVTSGLPFGGAPVRTAKRSRLDH